MTANNVELEEVGRAAEGNGSSVADLLARQEQLQGWIHALDKHADDVPPRVLQRVRADYESRLAGVVQHLGEHRDSLAADAQRLREQLAAVRTEREQTSDQLAEGRLRNRLGEWRDDEWEERRAELEEALAGLQEQEQEWEAELSRFDDLLRSIASSRSTPEPAEPRSVAQASHQTDPSDLFSVAPTSAAVIDADLGGAPAEPGKEPAQGAPIDPSDPDTRPASGVKCPECGYTNDATAWYCGVCGVDLA